MKNRLAIWVIGIGIILVGFIATIFINPTTSAQAISIQKWEYLTLKYSQNKIFAAEGEFRGESSFATHFYESVDVSHSTYLETFISDLTGECEFGPNSIEVVLDFEGRFQECIGKNYKGQVYFMNQLGLDGWEIVTAVNTSSQYSYNLEMLFKRSIP